MLKFPAVALILVFSVSAFSQPENLDDNSEKTKIENKTSADDPKNLTSSKGGKVEVPPEKARPVTIPKASDTSAVTIDGRPDEDVWKTAAVFKDFYQTNPGNNTEPSKKTEAYVFYDEKNLYIAFRCWDEKDKIRATIAKRDGVFGEDNVRVWLDTYDDQRRAYILGWNPLGIQADGIFTEGRGSDFSVDIVMESKGVIEDWGWSVEAKIPFKSLRYSAGEGKNWGFNVARNIDRLNDEFDSWMPDDRNVSGFLIKHGRITGLNEIKTERTLEVIPSLTVSETGSRVPDTAVPGGRFVNEPVKKDIGVTLKYSITPNITLDAAINPDFAEIEADAPIVEANRRFPVFFPEKRPFFLEGADTFNSPLQLFNSRSIVDPDIALKLTGKQGRNSFGFLVASDNAPGNFGENEINDPARRPFIDEFVDKNAYFAVARVKRDIGAENNIGVFLTARSFPESKNYVIGVDGRFKLNPRTVFQYQVAGTNSRKCFFNPEFDPLDNPAQAFRNGRICGGAIVDNQQVLGNQYAQYRTGNGIGYSATLDYSTETFGYTLETGGRTADYRVDAGFSRRSDNHFIFGGMRKSTKSRPDSKIIRINFFNGVSYSFDGRGRTQDIEYNANSYLGFQKNTFINFFGGVGQGSLYENEFGLVRNANREGAFFGDDFRKTKYGWLGTFFRTSPVKKFGMFAEASYNWNSFDFDFGAGRRYPRVSPAALAGDSRRDPGPGGQYRLAAGIDLAPTDPLSISFSVNKARLVRNDTGLTAFDSNIFSLRSTYQFTRFVFAKVRLDYNTLQSNVRGQYLLGWTPSPGKAFYIGYNDNLNYNGFNPYTGGLEQGFQRNTRKFFIRMSYLFRKSF